MPSTCSGGRTNRDKSLCWVRDILGLGLNYLPVCAPVLQSFNASVSRLPDGIVSNSDGYIQHLHSCICSQKVSWCQTWCQMDMERVSVCVCVNRCPGSEVAMQALTGRKVDLAFRVYQALLGAAAGGGDSQPMETEMQVSTAYNNFLYCSQSHLAATKQCLLLMPSSRCLTSLACYVIRLSFCCLSNIEQLCRGFLRGWMLRSCWGVTSLSKKKRTCGSASRTG